MKTCLQLILLFTIPVCLAASVNKQPEIKITASKDHVLPIELRNSILEVAETCLNRSDESFFASIKKVQSPFPLAPTESEIVDTATEIVVYDDESILGLIKTNFAAQIRGNIAKGGVYYLQLNGGGLLEAGDSFPAQLPQVEGESFTVTILEITSDGYILGMNDIVQKFNFEKKSGIIKKSEK